MPSRFRNRLRRAFRRLLGTGDPPERVARGLAAGILAAAFPLPGLQVPLSLLFAWLVRGNKLAALAGQTVSNAFTALPLAYAQFRVGSVLWPGSATNAEQARCLLWSIRECWSWSAPLESLGNLGAAWLSLGGQVLGPLALGVFVTGAGATVLSYAASLTALTVFHAYRLRRKVERGLRPQAHGERFVLPESGVDETDDKASAMRYALYPDTYVQAQSVKLLVDGRQAFPEMLAAISNAEKSVDMETYILRSDRTGRHFADALAGAASRGVKVRLLYDGVGCLGLPQEYIDGLLSSGVRVAVFRPLRSLWLKGLGALNRRDHRKILVVDESIAFTGGLNIGDEYAAKEDGGEGWRDTHCRLESPEVARQLLALIEVAWPRADEFPAPAEAPETRIAVRESGGQAIAKAASGPCAAASTDVPVQVLNNRDLFKRIRVRQTYLRAIKRARRYILLENAYFIPDRRIRRALRNAVRRGVVVGVVVPMYSDLPIVALASRALYGELLASGVRLFEYPVSMLHCKAAVIDDVWVVVSSYNLDHRSLLHNLEAGVLLLDRTLAQAMREQIVTDIERCREVTFELHAARAWNRALTEALAYQLRYWL